MTFDSNSFHKAFYRTPQQGEEIALPDNREAVVVPTPAQLAARITDPTLISVLSEEDAALGRSFTWYATTVNPQDLRIV